MRGRRFGALASLGDTGQVIFSDVSQDLLDRCRATAEEMCILERCRFVRAAAHALGPIADESVDAVTTRSVLIYVDQKDRAFAEFFRVLRSHGRISLFEPINRYTFPEPPTEWMGYETTGVEGLVARIRSGCEGDGPAGAMMDFDEGTLLDLAQGAGFIDIEVVLRRRVYDDLVPRPWQSFLASSPNPLAPTWGEAMDATL